MFKKGVGQTQNSFSVAWHWFSEISWTDETPFLLTIFLHDGSGESCSKSPLGVQLGWDLVTAKAIASFSYSNRSVDLSWRGGGGALPSYFSTPFPGFALNLSPVCKLPFWRLNVCHAHTSYFCEVVRVKLSLAPTNVDMFNLALRFICGIS